MTHPAFQVWTTYFVQRGNSSTLRTNTDEPCVVYETWQGSRIVNTGVEKRFPNTKEGIKAAMEHAKALNDEQS